MEVIKFIGFTLIIIFFQQEAIFVFSEFKYILATNTQNHSVSWIYFFADFLKPIVL